MQNSELFRRGVVVPLDDDALGRIRASNVLEHTSVKYAGIADGSDFEWLWERDFFARINAETGSMLDDYEEDELRVDATDAVALLASMFGQEIFASIAATPGSETSAQSLANSSIEWAEIETTSGAP